ncbi:unnamed protein product, partial [Polarella glacialis]
YAKSSIDGLALLKSGPDLLVQTASGQACHGSSKDVATACRPESLLSSRLTCRPDLLVGQTASGHACQGSSKEVPAEDFSDALRRFGKRLSKDQDPFEPWWSANSVRYGRAKRSSQVSSVAATGQQANRVLRGHSYNNGGNDNINNSYNNNDSKSPSGQQQGLPSPDGTWHHPSELFRSMEASTTTTTTAATTTAKQHPEQQPQQQQQHQLQQQQHQLQQQQHQQQQQSPEHMVVPVRSSPPHTPLLFSASQCLHDQARASACRLLLSGTPGGSDPANNNSNNNSNSNNNNNSNNINSGSTPRRSSTVLGVPFLVSSPGTEEWSESEDGWESDSDSPGTAPEFQTPPASRHRAGLSPAGGATLGSIHHQGNAHKQQQRQQQQQEEEQQQQEQQQEQQSLQVREEQVRKNWQEFALLAGWIPPAGLRPTYQRDNNNNNNNNNNHNNNNSNNRNKAAPWLEPLEDTPEADATEPGSFDEAGFGRLPMDSCADGDLQQSSDVDNNSNNSKNKNNNNDNNDGDMQQGTDALPRGDLVGFLDDLLGLPPLFQFPRRLSPGASNNDSNNNSNNNNSNSNSNNNNSNKSNNDHSKSPSEQQQGLPTPDGTRHCPSKLFSKQRQPQKHSFQLPRLLSPESSDNHNTQPQQQKSPSKQLSSGKIHFLAPCTPAVAGGA